LIETAIAIYGNTMLRDKFDLITVELISPINTTHRHPNSRVVICELIG
jgi:hypothetical protein